MLYALLALAVVIGILGVVNTLALSVVERTREIGLLRALGLTRRQLRTVIRTESALIALAGGVLGIGGGYLLGAMLQRAALRTGLAERRRAGRSAAGRPGRVGGGRRGRGGLAGQAGRQDRRADRHRHRVARCVSRPRG